MEEQQKIPDLQPKELKAISEQQHSYFVGMCEVLFNYFLFGLHYNSFTISYQFKLSHCPEEVETLIVFLCLNFCD